MIAYLKGEIVEIEGNEIILNVNDIGFAINTAHIKTLQVGKTYTFYIYEHIKEDEYSLYGFLDKNELRLFKLIVEHIQGVGPKTAMNIFRTLSFEEIRKAIEEKDYRPFLEVKGLGEKTAKRIVLEIGGELFREEEEDKVKEVYQALINLGFEKDSVKNALKSLDKNLTVEELIKEGLKKLSNEKYKA